MRVTEWLEAFWEEQPVGVVLPSEQVEALAIKAVRFMRGYADLESERIADGMEPNASVCAADVDAEGSLDTCLTESEWSIVGPLFRLYVELENAVYLEASRGLGVDVYRRATSEIQADITTLESELPHKAFYFGAWTE